MLQPRSRAPNRPLLSSPAASPLPPFHRPAAPAVSPNPSSAAAEGHHLPDLTVLGRHLKSPCKTHAVLVLSTGGAPSSAPAAQQQYRKLQTSAQMGASLSFPSNGKQTSEHEEASKPGSSKKLRPGHYHPRLIPDLPDEISLQILARMPRMSYLSRKMVSRSWKAAITGSELYRVRKELRVDEEWIYILSKGADGKLSWHAFDPLSSRWQRLPLMPGVARGGSRLGGLVSAGFRISGVIRGLLGQEDWLDKIPFCACAVGAVDGCLYVLGGFSRATAIKTVCKYDPSINLWQEVSSMSTARAFGRTGLLNNKLYVVGGVIREETGLAPLQSAEVFDPATGIWADVPNMPFSKAQTLPTAFLADLLKPVATGMTTFGGKLYVPQSLYSWPFFVDVGGEVFDPETCSWSDMPVGLSEGWPGRQAGTKLSAVVDGDLYALEPPTCSDGGKIKIYDPKEDTWKAVVSEHLALSQKFGSATARHPNGMPFWGYLRELAEHHPTLHFGPEKAAAFSSAVRPQTTATMASMRPRRLGKPTTLIFSTLLLLSSGAIKISSAPLPDNSTDVLWLEAFKHEIISDPSGWLSSWNSSSSHCLWPGVKCSPTHPGRVVALQLFGLNLAGQISSSIGNLTFLTTLNLSTNGFSGQLPPLDHLQKLQVLDLSINQLHDSIPDAITNCSNLRKVDLAKNFLIGEIPPKPTNILLDDDMNAYLGDFGIASLVGHSSSSTSVGLKGTIGYIAPEYAQSGQASVHGDVYSFGIVLLEVLIGKRPTDPMFENELNMVNFVERNYPDQILHIIDARLDGECKDYMQTNTVTEDAAYKPPRREQASSISATKQPRKLTDTDISFTTMGERVCAGDLINVYKGERRSGVRPGPRRGHIKLRIAHMVASALLRTTSQLPVLGHK
ncbi:hypothetical protein ZWY2020_047553 [Hordeum vulgare]|nr:hypothetical protein ZWY2020_047553 [Hordeum vulgare]